MEHSLLRLELSNTNTSIPRMPVAGKTCRSSRDGSSTKKCARENAPLMPGKQHSSAEESQPAVSCRILNRRQRIGRQSHHHQHCKAASRNGSKKSPKEDKMAETKAKPNRREQPSLSVDSGRGDELSSSCESTVFELPLSATKHSYCSSDHEDEVFQDCLSHIPSEESSVYCTPLTTPHTHTPHPHPPSTDNSLDHDALCDSLGKVAQDRRLETCDSHVTTTEASDSSSTPDQPPPVQQQSRVSEEASEISNCKENSSFFIGDIELLFDDNLHDEGVDFEVFSPTTVKHSRDATRKKIPRPVILTVPQSHSHGRLTSNRHSFEFSSISTASPQSSVCSHSSHPPSPLTLSPSPTTETAREPVFSKFDEANLNQYDIEFMHPEIDAVVSTANMVYAHTLEEEQQAEATVKTNSELEELNLRGKDDDVSQEAVVNQEDEWPDLSCASSPSDVTPVPDTSPILAEEVTPPLHSVSTALPSYASQMPWYLHLQHQHHQHHPPPPLPPHPYFVQYPVSQNGHTGFYHHPTGFWPHPYPPVFPTDPYLPPSFSRPTEVPQYVNLSTSSSFSTVGPSPNTMAFPTANTAEVPYGNAPGVCMAEVPYGNAPGVPEADVPEVPTGNVPDVPAAEVQTSDVTQVQTSDAAEVQTSDATEVPTTEATEVHICEATELPMVDSLEICHAGLETHPLHATWVMWYDKITGNNRNQLSDYKASLKTLSTVGCVEDFWRLYNNIVQPSELSKNANYHFFKQNIHPLWEDPANKNGGKWVLTIKDDAKMLDKTWMELLLSLIGEQMIKADLITGAVVSRRKKGDRIALWTNTKGKKMNIEICKEFIKVLALARDVSSKRLPVFVHHLSEGKNGLSLVFMHHADSLRSHTSYQNDARISLRDHTEVILKSLADS